MAIIHSVTMGKARGSLGNVTLRYQGGDTIASQKILKGSQKIGTLSQVLRRVRLANLVNAYQSLNALGDGAGMAEAFPARGPRVTNFNMFVSRNIGRAGVGGISLSREAAAAGTCVAAPFLISEGDLAGCGSAAVIDLTPSGATPGTEFSLELQSGRVYFTGAVNETVPNFMSRLKSSYGLHEGDVVTIFGMEWRAGDDAKFASFQFVIDSSATSIPGVDEELIGSNTMWACVDPLVNPITGGVGGATLAVVVGRRSTSGYRVSTSAFLATPALAEVVNRFSDDAAQAAAALSYGYKDDPYLQDGVNP